MELLSRDDELIVRVPEPVMLTQCMPLVAESPIDALVSVALPDAEYVIQVAFPQFTEFVAVIL